MVIKSIGWLALFLCVSVNAEERPNIVLLMGDDHGWDETGYNGHPYLQTPVLDAMAAHGLRLDHFYSAHPSCSPTRGSVLTGRHPNRYGVFRPGWSIRPEEITIAKILSEAGYDCSHFGKWHLGPVKASSPTNPGAMGFNYWLSHDNFFELNPVLSRNGGPPEKFVGEGSEVIVSEAIRYLTQVEQQDKPFFVVIWYGSPHEPYSGLPEDLALYQGLPARYNDLKVRVTSNKTGEQVERPLGDVLQERYAEITAMDRSIGHLRDWLAAHRLRDNTLLWYCGDNGSWADGAVTSPFRGYKGTVYEGGVRVPGIIEMNTTREQQNSLTTAWQMHDTVDGCKPQMGESTRITTGRPTISRFRSRLDKSFSLSLIYTSRSLLSRKTRPPRRSCTMTTAQCTWRLPREMPVPSGSS